MDENVVKVWSPAERKALFAKLGYDLNEYDLTDIHDLTTIIEIAKLATVAGKDAAGSKLSVEELAFLVGIARHS